MYFWNINKLKSDFIDGGITEKNTLKYLVAYTILVGFAMIPFVEGSQSEIIASALMIPISILGLFYAYSSNGGNFGHNFIAKYFAIGWVVTVRFFVMVIPIVAIIGAFTAFLGINMAEHATLWSILIEVVIMALYFWRIAIHISDTTEQNA